MPDPKPKESKEEFIARFMSSEEAKKSFPDKKQRLAVAYSKWRKAHPEDKPPKGKETPVTFKVVKVKETEDESGETVYTFIGANTLPDRAKGTAKDGTPVVGEILSKKVLDNYANLINDPSVMGGKYGSYRTVSLFHDRVYSGNMALEEAGFVVPGSAVVQEIASNPGNFELLVDVEVNKYYQPSEKHPDYTPDKIHYKIEKGALGLSLEYNNLVSQERVVDFKGEKYTYVMDTDDFRGFGFARPNLIGNTGAVRVKEIQFSAELDKSTGGKKMGEETDEGKIKEDADAKLKEMESKLADAEAKLKEFEGKGEESEAESAKLKEEIDAMKLEMDETATKLKESIERAFSAVEFKTPAKTEDKNAKVKEIYQDFSKFKEQAMEHIDANEGYLAKFKEMVAVDGPGFAFEKWQTVQVKCKGSQFVVVPSAKTKDAIDASDMPEGTYYQTNAMFADRYVVGITETFLKTDNLLKAINKEQHIGGNDKYQWRLWKTFGDVTGTNTAAVNPNITSVGRTQRDFIKMETRICEYRDGVEVTDFTQYHSMAAIGDLLGIELNRAAEYVTCSMNADLYKAKVDDTSAWWGFNGLIGIADSATYTACYGRTRTAALRLLDATTANTYLSTSEAISVSVVRAGYEKVLAHGSNLSDLVIVIHPTQCRKLFDSEDAAIRNNILLMSGAPPAWGFNRAVLPTLDGIPMIRDYQCEASSAAADMFGVVDMSADKGFNLIVSKPLSARGLAKVGTSESAYVSFWGTSVYKSPRNVFVHTGLTT